MQQPRACQPMPVACEPPMTLAGVSTPANHIWQLPLAVTTLLNSLPFERAATLQRRVAAQYPGLRKKLGALYAHTEHFESFLEQLLVNAITSAASRDEDLWQLDIQRESQPHWHQQGMTAYCAYVDKFAGTLDGVHARIDYLKELGISYLHLLPFLKAGSGPNDGGFAVASFSEIEPALGNMTSLRQLCRALQASGISLCSDFVLNHVSHDHHWAREALQGNPQYRDYFHWLPNEETVHQYEQHLGQVFPSTAPGNFTYIAQRNAWVWTTFYPYQWDLNYANPAVFSEIADALLNLANHGVEAFRLDSTGFLWKRLGTHCMNQPEVHCIVQALRCLTNIAAPATLLKAEAIMPTRELPPYFGIGATQEDECHIAYHSSLMAASWLSLAEESPEVVSEVLVNTPDLPQGCSWLTYVRCHDDIGWNVLRPELLALGTEPQQRLLAASRHFSGETTGSYSKGSAFQANDSHSVHGTNGMTAALTGLSHSNDPMRTLALARIELLYSLSFFVGGMPLIYMGDELGMDNTPEDEMTQRTGSDGRELHRPIFNDHAALQRHAPSTLAGQLFGLLKNLNSVRSQHLVKDPSIALRVLSSEHANVLCLRRNQAVGLFNFCQNTTTFNTRSFSEQPMRNLLAPHTPLTGTEIELKPYGTAWLLPVH
jgi:amylosucrase